MWDDGKSGGEVCEKKKMSSMKGSGVIETT